MSKRLASFIVHRWVAFFKSVAMGWKNRDKATREEIR